MAVILAAAIALLYASTLAGLARDWVASPDDSYGIVLIAVALVVLWQRRDACARASRLSPPRGVATVAPLAAALLLYLVGQFGADIFITRLSLVAVVAGAVWFVAGRAVVRTLAAPLAFAAMAVPLPALVVNAVTLPLQLTASRIAEATLTAGGVAVFRDGNVLDLPSTALEVAEACSGLRSLISLTAIAVLLAWALPRISAARRIAIVAAAVPVAIVMNGMRIAGIGFACEAWGPRMASGAWHELSGWLTFIASIGVLLLVQRLLAPAPPVSPATARMVTA